MKTKIAFLALSLALSSIGFAQAGEHYECRGLASCHCIPSGQPGSGMTCDYYGVGTGSDQASAASAAQADAKNDCEQSCTRKTGNSCYNITAYNCELVRN